MRVLLVFPDIHSFHNDPYAPGLDYIASYLKAAGHEVKLEYVASVSEFGRVLESARSFDPGVVGFTSVETQFRHVKALSSMIKAEQGPVTVCGGVHVTLFPEIVREVKSLDGVIVGEGERAFLELVRQVERGEDYSGLNNFCYYDRYSDMVVKNPLNPLEEDLDVFPLPDRSAFDMQGIIDARDYVPFYFSRGCPYHCTYCCNHALARVYGKVSNRVRRRSVSKCMEEIEHVVANYRIPKSAFLLFGDDLFTQDKEWLEQFLSEYKKNYRLPFQCSTRSNITSSELFAGLKDAGCIRVLMSIESGSDFIRNEVMKRNISKEQIFNSFKWAHQNRIKTNGICIIGVPFETRDMIEETIDVVAKTYTEGPGVNVFYPYKGTELRRVCEENGFLPDDIGEFEERKESILNLPTISREDLSYYHDNWKKLVISRRSLPYRVKYRIRRVPHFAYRSVARLSPGLAKRVKQIVKTRPF